METPRILYPAFDLPQNVHLFDASLGFGVHVGDLPRTQWMGNLPYFIPHSNQSIEYCGLVLTTVAVFIFTQPPLKQINYAASGPYTLLSESLVFSLFGLLFQLYTCRRTELSKAENLQSFKAKSMVIHMPYHHSLNSGLYIWHISTATHLCHLCDRLPVLFEISSDFTGATFGLFVTYLIASIIPSPVYPRLHKLLWGTTDCADEEDSEDSDNEDKEHSEKEAGSAA
ncbi:hypothetical protein EDD22DRAFT_407635 [Suillus occidentalis]|nr:hypothetical protein EDD22DRAFT_407635 [Suillus occidentalis]